MPAGNYQGYSSVPGPGAAQALFRVVRTLGQAAALFHGLHCFDLYSCCMFPGVRWEDVNNGNVPGLQGVCVVLPQDPWSEWEVHSEQLSEPRWVELLFLRLQA